MSSTGYLLTPEDWCADDGVTTASRDGHAPGWWCLSSADHEFYIHEDEIENLVKVVNSLKEKTVDD